LARNARGKLPCTHANKHAHIDKNTKLGSKVMIPHKNPANLTIAMLVGEVGLNLPSDADQRPLREAGLPPAPSMSSK
jgi:hypothetical protein